MPKYNPNSSSTSTTQQESYIKIPNYIYDPIVIDNTNTGTLFHRIGTGGFTVLTFLQIVQQNKPSERIRITDIKSTLHMKKNETALKYFNAIWRENLITVQDKTYGDKIKALEFLTYSISPKYLNAKKYEPISTSLFNEKISILNPNEWSLLCYLTRCHNYSFGDINSMGSIAYQGYACPTFEQIKQTLDIGSNDTINNILEHLEKLQLINILKSDVVSSYSDAKGVTKFKRVSNKYIVHNKVPGTKYFLTINKRQYDKALKEKSTWF